MKKAKKKKIKEKEKRKWVGFTSWQTKRNRKIEMSEPMRKKRNTITRAGARMRMQKA